MFLALFANKTPMPASDFLAACSGAPIQQEAVLKATAVRSPLQRRSCRQFFLVLLVFHQSCSPQGGGVWPGGLAMGGLGGGGGWGGGGGLRGGGRRHFIHLATWCFTPKGLRTITWKQDLQAKLRLEEVIIESRFASVQRGLPSLVLFGCKTSLQSRSVRPLLKTSGAFCRQ